MAIEKKYLIEKRNVLNEVRSNTMTLQEMRFFSIYLARINSRDISTRVVRFYLDEYKKIMDLGKLNISQLRNSTDTLLKRVIGLELETGGYRSFQLFKRTEFTQENEDSEWYIEIDAHDEALPLLFDFKERYFTYELWNALRLKSANQLRMYEILKQYERFGKKVFKVSELKELLGMKATDHPRFNNFILRVLEPCKEALEMYTDIKFTWEPEGKMGKGGKVLSIKFFISKNEDYVDALSLEDFIDLPKSAINSDNIPSWKEELLDFLSDACSNEFNNAEIQILYDLIIQILPHKPRETHTEFQLRAYDHLKHRYDELNWRSGQKEIKNRFGYLRKILDADIKENESTEVY